MLYTKAITKKMEDFKQIENLYFEAFPRHERVPMQMLLLRTRDENIHFEAYYDETIFIGFTYVVTVGNVTYLMYLATASEVRCRGYGEQILNHFKEHYPNTCLVLNCEAEDEKANNNDLRLRRQNFYFRNGYVRADYSCELNRHRMLVLMQNGAITRKEFLAVFRKFFSPIIYLFVKPKLISDHSE